MKRQLKYDYERLKSLSNKIFSTEEHATTHLFCPYVFTADALHYSMPPKRGCRVSLQLQHEKRKVAT